MSVALPSSSINLADFMAAGLASAYPLVVTLQRDFHSWVIDASIAKLVKESAITPPKADTPRKFEDYDIDTIHINAYDFAAWTYNAISAVTITTLALGILGFLGFTSTVLSLVFLTALSSIPKSSLEETLESNKNGVLERSASLQATQAPATGGEDVFRPIDGSDDEQEISFIQALVEPRLQDTDEALPLHFKRWMRLSEGALPELPPGVMVDQEYANWEPDFIRFGSEAVFKNPTLRLDFIWDRLWNPQKYEGQIKDFTQLDEEAAAKDMQQCAQQPHDPYQVSDEWPA